MRQTESVHVAIQNVSAHESDKKSQTSLQTCFPNFQKWRKGTSGKVVVFRIYHQGLKHTVAELLPTVQVGVVVEEELAHAEFGPTSGSVCPYNIYLPILVGYIAQTLILNMINQHSHVYYVSQILHFDAQIALRFVPGRKRSGACVTAPSTWNER